MTTISPIKLFGPSISKSRQMVQKNKKKPLIFTSCGAAREGKITASTAIDGLRKIHLLLLYNFNRFFDLCRIKPAPATTETDIRTRGISFAPFRLPSPAHSRMVLRSPWSAASITPRLSPEVSRMRSISPRIASAASSCILKQPLDTGTQYDAA